MEKVLTFKVEISNLEDKIYRVIKITDRMTVADLAYTILATFNSLAYHIWSIKYNNSIFDCFESDLKFVDDYSRSMASKIRLNKLNLSMNDTLEMDYDFGTTTTFIITYLNSEDVNVFKEYLYPCIVEGKGNGMIDDISGDELIDIVEEADRLGYSTFYLTPGYGRNKKYDYKKFDLKKNNTKLKGLILQIKNSYEVIDE